MRRIFLLSILAFSLFQAFGQNNYVLKKDHGFASLTDSNDQLLIPPVYERLGWTYGFNFPVGDVIGYYDGAWGLISLKNKVVTAPKYYSLEAIHKSLIIASIKGKFSNELFYGVINSKGETIIDFRFHYMEQVKDVLIVGIRKPSGTQYGLVTRQNKTLLPIKFKNIRHLHESLFAFEHNNGKTGIIHRDGRQILSAVLDSIAPMQNGLSRVVSRGKFGLIDSTGQVVFQPQYKSITTNRVPATATPFNHIEIKTETNELVTSYDLDTLFQLPNKKSALVSNEHVTIVSEKHEPIYEKADLISIQSFKDNIIVEDDHAFHVISHLGGALDMDGFDEVVNDELYLYARKKDRWQIFNAYGSNFSKRTFEDVTHGSNNLIPVKINNYWGYSDHSGAIAISVKFDSASIFKGKLAKVHYLGAHGLINQFGDWLGEAHYDEITILDNNKAIVTLNSRIDLIDYRGDFLFQTYNQLETHPLGYKEITEQGKAGLISHDGEIIFYPEYDYISDPIADAYLIIKKDGKTGLTNLAGHWIIQPSSRYQEIINIHDERIGVKIDGQFGFIDFNQNLRIANRYADIQPFHEGLAAVKLNGKWGIINKKEQLVAQPNYDLIRHFEHGLAIVVKNGKYGALNQDGLEVIATQFDSLYRSANETIIGYSKGKYGVFNKTGKALLPVSYTSVEDTAGDGLIVRRRGLMGLVGPNGRFTIPMKYRSVVELPDGNFMCLIPAD